MTRPAFTIGRLIGAVAGSLLVPDPPADELFDQLQVRATTGLGAEV